MCVHVLSSLQVILGIREVQTSALPVLITELTLAVGATYGIGAVARKSIGESKILSALSLYRLEVYKSNIQYIDCKRKRDGPRWDGHVSTSAFADMHK